MTTDNTLTPPHCEDCGHVLERGVEAQTFRYKGRSVQLDQPAWYCPIDRGHEPVMDEPDVAVADAVFTRLRTDVDGTLAPEEVQRIRRRLGLSQRQAGRLLGGGPMAFHKYEKGVIAVTRSTTMLLWLLDRHPELLSEIPGRQASAA